MVKNKIKLNDKEINYIVKDICRQDFDLSTLLIELDAINNVSDNSFKYKSVEDRKRDISIVALTKALRVAFPVSDQSDADHNLGSDWKKCAQEMADILQDTFFGFVLDTMLDSHYSPLRMCSQLIELGYDEKKLYNYLYNIWFEERGLAKLDNPYFTDLNAKVLGKKFTSIDLFLDAMYRFLAMIIIYRIDPHYNLNDTDNMEDYLACRIKVIKYMHSLISTYVVNVSSSAFHIPPNSGVSDALQSIIKDIMKLKEKIPDINVNKIVKGMDTKLVMSKSSYNKLKDMIKEKYSTTNIGKKDIMDYLHSHPKVLERVMKYYDLEEDV